MLTKDPNGSFCRMSEDENSDISRDYTSQVEKNISICDALAASKQVLDANDTGPSRFLNAMLLLFRCWSPDNNTMPRNWGMDEYASIWGFIRIRDPHLHQHGWLQWKELSLRAGPSLRFWWWNRTYLDNSIWWMVSEDQQRQKKLLSAAKMARACHFCWENIQIEGMPEEDKWCRKISYTFSLQKCKCQQRQ